MRMKLSLNLAEKCSKWGTFLLQKEKIIEQIYTVKNVDSVGDVATKSNRSYNSVACIGHVCQSFPGGLGLFRSRHDALWRVFVEVGENVCLVAGVNVWHVPHVLIGVNYQHRDVLNRSDPFFMKFMDLF